MPAPVLSLEVLDVLNPCSVPWESMQGDERIRFCGQCQNHVFNLSGLTRREAVRLIVEKEGTLCARFFRRADGTVVTRACLAVRVGRGVTRAVRWTLASFAAFALFLLGRSSTTVGGLFGEAPKPHFEQVGQMCLRSPGWPHPQKAP